MPLDEHVASARHFLRAGVVIRAVLTVGTGIVCGVVEPTGAVAVSLVPAVQGYSAQKHMAGVTVTWNDTKMGD